MQAQTQVSLFLASQPPLRLPIVVCGTCHRPQPFNGQELCLADIRYLAMGIQTYHMDNHHRLRVVSYAAPPAVYGGKPCL